MACNIQHYYTWIKVPRNHKTEKQWLKLYRRLKKDAEAVGTITMIFDRPRERPKGVEPVPPEECEQIRRKLEHSCPDSSDRYDLYRLDRAGQLAVCNLYDFQDTEEITAFTEKEAEKLLGYMIWDCSHEDHYITETTVDGKRERATWKSEYSTPDLTAHLAGDRYYGTKKGRMTMLIAPDLDRHSGRVPGEEHVRKCLKVGEVLARKFPQYRFAPEINDKNGSVKFFGWLPDFAPIPRAEGLAEEVRQVLQQELPEYDFSRMEIFPSNSPQIFAPLRRDKTMVIGSGVVKKAKKYRMPKQNGKRRRKYYEAYSCADYFNWVYFSDTSFDSETFEKHLREAVARCPDESYAETSEKEPKARTRTTKQEDRAGGMGDIGRLKGRCASTLIKFWSELEQPEDDTIGKYMIVTLRILRYEGLDQEEAVEWVEERLQALEHTEFSDRLTDNFGEIQRVMGYAVEAVWNNNGYQKDPEQSDIKLKASVEAWARRGFRLHDPETWNNHEPVVNPDMKLVWTSALLALLPELAEVANATEEQAKRFLELVLAFVESNNELAESMVGRLLERCGIKGRSRQKQHDVRKFLVEHRLLLKQKNYFCDKATGYRHGNFYTCGAAVTFEHEAEAARVFAATPHTHCIYSHLSLDVEPVGFTDPDWLELVMEKRHLNCDERYRERRSQLKTVFRRAA